MRIKAYLVLVCVGFLLPVQPASTNELPQECHEHLQTFLEGETWEVVGNSAINMYNAGCWPALQGASNGGLGNSPITTCDELGPYVINMTKEQASQGADVTVIMNLYEIVPWFSPKPPGEVERVLSCWGKARVDTGQYHDIMFYLDRDPDGQEFISMEYH